MKFILLIAVLACVVLSQRYGSGTGTGTGSVLQSSEIAIDPRLSCVFNCGKQINWQDVNIFENLFRPSTLQNELVKVIDQHGQCFSQCLTQQGSGSQQRGTGTGTTGTGTGTGSSY